jgi:2-polyprenyl-6-methoxyphenol hydroxylase-like FAD-dependent oxidoreductase
MAPPPEVCIRGAGIVGRALALLLARERVHVALLTDAKPPAEDVRAYALNAAARTLLESLRVWPDAAHATPVREMIVRGDAGGQVRFDAAEQKVEALAWIVDVPALEQRLGEAVRFQPCIEVVAAPVAAPLTVICEGRASATREALGVGYEVTRYPHHAIATRLVAERPHGGIARQWFNDKGEILGLLPLTDAAPSAGGDRSLALVWSVSPRRAADLLTLDPEAFCAELREAAHDTLGALTLISERAAWPLQRAIANRWSGHFDDGNAWALAGDAAHTVHPLAGQGLNLGLADVAALSDIIKTRDYWRGVGDARLLRRYERERRADALSMSLATDGLQQLFARDTGPLPALRNWGMRGFDRLRPLKHWVTRRAMGLPSASEIHA